MKKSLLLLAALLPVLASHAQISVPPTELHYNVHYHWGLVNVMIAHGTVCMQTDGDIFTATLDGNSIPWEGRVFCVSDTLKARMQPTAGLSRETVIYENGWYLKPKTTQFNSRGFDPTEPANYKNIQGEGTLPASDNTMEAITITADMLGLFYYFREIDFDSLTEGKSLTIPVERQNGSAERVVLTYMGRTVANASGTSYPTYSVDFQYSYRGEMSGYTVRAEVGVTDRIPIILSADLPIGHVEMIYTE